MLIIVILHVESIFYFFVLHLSDVQSIGYIKLCKKLL